jgi:hypothetical protein
MYAEHDGDPDISENSPPISGEETRKKQRDLASERQISRAGDDASRYYWWWPFRR